MGHPSKTNLCACGCGELVSYKFKRGHIGKTAEGKSKIKPTKPDEEVFVLNKDGKAATYSSRARYANLRRKALTFHCDICGIVNWRGQPAPIVVDHVNGYNNDHRLENLRLVCRNCDGQLPTFAGRNRGKGEKFRR